MSKELSRENSTHFRNDFIASSVVAFSISSEDEENYRKLPNFSLNLLLVEQIHKNKIEFSIPTTLIRKNQNSIQAIQRELFDKAQISKCYIEQLYTFTDFTNNDLSTNTELSAQENVSTISHIALFDNDKESQLEDVDISKDKNTVQWFKISYNFVKTYYENNSSISEYLLELTNEKNILRATVLQKKNEHELDNTVEVISSIGISQISAQIISYAINRLRGKIDYTDIAFRLLPKTFTIKKLQRVYELVLGKNLLDANFRRKILPKLEEDCVSSQDNTQSLGHRKAKLYSLKTDHF